MWRPLIATLVFCGTLGVASTASARDWLVRDKDAYVAAVKAARAGDSVTLADGVWRDFPIVFTGTGTETQPITLRGRTPGKVIISGVSSLRIAGKWLVVRGLVFRDGYTPGDEVIAFRNGSKGWAEHVRLTEVVIDRFNQPDRRKEDHWVSLAGQDNRIDHSHFEGKANAGAMMVVLRDKPLPLDNRIRIDHNYFGPRPVLGSNGGETIRIGTSTESASDSHSIVEDNIFEDCDGEVEIISVKSGANIVRRNLFRRSQGAVVLRHGDGNLVENNIFFGENVPHTGGVRVINRRQTVRGNYMEGLAGTDFTSAITVMNGVPNSPVNRYVQVSDALIERNTVTGASRITLAAGADAERAAPPLSTRFVANLIATQKDAFRADGPIDGISFIGNVATAPAGAVPMTIERRPVPMKRAANGLLYPTDRTLADVGAPRDLRVVDRADVGVSWYAKPAALPVAFGSGRTHPVTDAAALTRAVAAAGQGDIIALRAGDYRVDAPLVLTNTLTLTGPGSESGNGAARLVPTSATLFRLENGGRVRLERLSVSGAAAPGTPGNAIIRTAPRSMTANYTVEIDDCMFADMKAADYNVITATAGTLADLIAIRDSQFADVSGAILAGRSELGKEGWYSAERVTFANNRFTRVGTIADLLRAGTDESTYGPHFTMTGSTVEGSGQIILSGVQETTITGNRFDHSGGIVVSHSVGTPATRIADNSFTATPAPDVRELSYRGPMRAMLDHNEVTK